MRSAFLFDPHKKDRLPAVATYCLEMRPGDARNLIQPFLDLALRLWKRIALARREHPLNPLRRDLVQTVIIEDAYARRGNGCLRAESRSDEEKQGSHDEI